MFFKLIVTGQGNLKHFPISFYNIQCVRNASPIFPTEAEAQPTPAAAGWILCFNHTHLLLNCNSSFHPLLEQNLVSKRAGWAVRLYYVRRLYFHYITDCRKQRPYYGNSCPQRALELISGRLEVTLTAKHKWEGHSAKWEKRKFAIPSLTWWLKFVFYGKWRDKVTIKSRKL